MKKLIVVLVLLTIALSVFGEAKIGTGDWLHADWLHFTTKSDVTWQDFSYGGEYFGFVVGVASLAASLSGQLPLYTSTVGMRFCYVVGNFLDKHPERWAEDADVLVIDALKEAYPKR
jgi:hypothetical protein